MSENQIDEQTPVEEPVAEEPVEAQPDGTATAAKPRSKFAQKLDDFFGISKAGSTIRVEVIGGLTTFMAMVYILMVNAGMFSDPYSTGGEAGQLLGVSYGAIYIATALSAIIGTILMALVARLPMAQATGMGLNAFFVYTICLTSGLSYANSLVLILIEGVVFIIFTVTGLRKHIFNAIPKAVRVAIPAGIGLFIAFIGLQNVGLVIPDSSTGVTLASLNVLNGANYSTIVPLLITLLGVVVMAVLSKKGVKGAILWSILGGAVLYFILMGFGCIGNAEVTYKIGEDSITISYEAFKELSVVPADFIFNSSAACRNVFDSISFANPFTAFKEWGTQSVGQVFASGFDFSGYLNGEGHNAGSLVLVIITSAFAFCMVDMFDTMGTLYGAAARGNMLTKEGEVPNMNKAMLCDAIATCTGAIVGTSTVTTFVESSSGIGAGARTGLASVITAACFVVAMFLSPIAQLIPTCATAAALVYVGILMMNCVREIEWTDAADAVPAFLTIAMMPFTYNISYGIAFGMISWLLIKLFTGKFKEIKPTTVVIGALFFAMFLLTH